LQSKLLKLSEIAAKMEVLETRVLSSEDRSGSVAVVDGEFVEIRKIQGVT
jgi:hypothetical protein